MQYAVYLEWAFLALLCAVMATLAVFWIAPRQKASARDSHLPRGDTLQDHVFLFDGPDLIDASTTARALVPTSNQDFDWGYLHKALVARFPGFPETQTAVQGRGRISVPAGADGDSGEAYCEWIDGITRVHLRDQAHHRVNPPPTSETMKELETLRLVMGQAPYPVWYVTTQGDVGWCNAAYEALSEKAHGSASATRTVMFPSASGKGPTGKKTRTSVAISGSDQKLWFDVTVVEHETGFLCYAVDINAVVDAEAAQRNFVQTLAKTFAQLSIGLAIFDRNRQLALFNPALIDLTALPADFLSSRPNLLSFFDRLRDHRMMPEPKNYSSWRHQMADLVVAAADGRYQETWTLPSGAVYSVSGRPHPDGAVAFLFEDITAEITLTRRFRTDLEVNQSMLDQLEDAIVVFSSSGTLSFSNAAYRKLWRVDPENSFVQMTILDAIRIWKNLCHATQVMGEVHEFISSRDNRTEWRTPIQLTSGKVMTCGVFPIDHGASMVVFSSLPHEADTGQTNMGSQTLPELIAKR